MLTKKGRCTLNDFYESRYAVQLQPAGVAFIDMLVAIKKEIIFSKE